MERGDACEPKLLDLITKERDWMVRDSGGGGENEDEKLELKLGPPGAEDWNKIFEKKRIDEPSVLSLAYIPKASKTSKRGFEGFQQQQQQSFEMKACSPSSSHATPSLNAAAATTRTSSVPVVGWPPIRSFRKNLASSSLKPPSVSSENEGSETGAKPEISKKGLFVKINMDGVPIGRKVDLMAYDNYEKLSSAVEELFQGLLAAQKDPAAAAFTQYSAEQRQAFTGLLDGSGEYTLVYEDSEGDRMLAGDVPWEMFVTTAKRLRVLKSSELSMLALGAVSRKRTATES